MTVYDTSAIAHRYKVNQCVVFHWIRERYLDAIKEDGSYKVTEDKLFDFERTLGPVVRYELAEEKRADEDGNPYIAYGLRITEAITERVIMEITDISTDRERVLELARITTEGMLNPIHIYDVIEDFFYS